MINDPDKQVKMASFIDSERILLQIENRYMLFDKIGCFIDEIEFEDKQVYSPGKKIEVDRSEDSVIDEN